MTMSDQRSAAVANDSRRMSGRELIVAALAVTLGAGIAWVDTRPTWDDTGVTAGALLLTAGLAAGAGLRWWAAALLVAVPILVAEMSTAGWGISITLAFTAAGSLLGATLRRMAGAGRNDSER
jgi:hypothetical protein